MEDDDEGETRRRDEHRMTEEDDHVPILNPFHLSFQSNGRTAGGFRRCARKFLRRRILLFVHLDSILLFRRPKRNSTFHQKNDVTTVAQQLKSNRIESNRIELKRGNELYSIREEYPVGWAERFRRDIVQWELDRRRRDFELICPCEWCASMDRWECKTERFWRMFHWSSRVNEELDPVVSTFHWRSNCRNQPERWSTCLRETRGISSSSSSPHLHSLVDTSSWILTWMSSL